MAELLISGKKVLVDDEDVALVSKYNWCVNSKGYVFHQIRSCGKNFGVIFMHRLILNVTSRDVLVDHKNHNPMDNRKENIRPATRFENQRNRKSTKNSTSKYLGVYKITKQYKYRSTISIYAKIFLEKKHYHLGSFDTERDAAIAYNEAAKKYFGEFANLNEV